MKFDETERWANYRIANSRFPDVRQQELGYMLQFVNPQRGERIAELGTGNGALTVPLGRAVGNMGIVYTFDSTEENLCAVSSSNYDALNIVPVPEKNRHPYVLPIPDQSVDKVCTIATLHHHDDRTLKTGLEGRKSTIKECYRILKPKGKLLVADVAHNTVSQRYFDAIDNPTHCSPNGHPHDFLSEQLTRSLCEEAGFRNISYAIRDVPWQFKDEQEAAVFLHTIHNAKCTPQESLSVAKSQIPFYEKDGSIFMGWQLFYLSATKR